MDKLVLIDGNSLINRAFYATPPLSAKDGTPTNAVYAFSNMLVKIIGEIEPKYILVAFDRKEPTFRHKMYAEYKGTRKPMPEELRPQIDLMKEVLDTMNIARFELAGIEADDIIGTLSKKFDVFSIIITGDKDSFQLVSDKASVYFTRKGISELDIYSAENFKEKTGIEPKQIIDLKSMMGDSSDNIPGIAGVGEKTALGLVQTYGSLENLYAHTDELKGKLKEKVEESKDVAYLSKTLATINTNVEIPLSLDDMTYTFPFPEATKRKFLSLDIRNLLKKEEIFASGSANGERPAKEEKTSDYAVVEVKSESGLPVFDKEAVYYIIFGKTIDVFDGKTEYKISVTDNFFDQGLTYERALAAVGKILGDPSAKAVVFGKKEIMHELDVLGIEFRATADDVIIEKYLVNQSGREDKLEDVLEEYGFDVSAPAVSLCSLHKELSEKMKEEGVEKLYREIELPLVDVLFSMEKDGFKIDIKALDEMTAQYEKAINAILRQISDIAGEDFNPNSPKQLGVILFEKLGLKHGKKTKSGYSTNAETLEYLKDEHEIVPLILRYRQIQKLYSTYLKGLRPLIDPKTGLVHTCFNQTLTATGRLSSKEPNLQNIPVRMEEGKEIRKLFVSSFDGGKIVGADYSQIELRLLAHFSGCKPLIDAFTGGTDIHAITASQVFGVPLSEVTPTMRREAKAVNFGIIYGISDFGLAEQLKISNKRAGEYIKKYFEMYPSVKEYMDKNVEFAREHGFVMTFLGRKRYIREINSANYNQRSFGERAAMNMPLQGASADIIKIAMIGVYNAIKSRGLRSKLILQVHDELLVDTAPDEVEIVKEILKTEMQGAVALSVPLDVETECGDRWYDAK